MVVGTPVRIADDVYPGVIILGPFVVCCISCVPITLPSLEINTFLAGGFKEIGVNPELVLVPKVGAIGLIPVLRTTDIEPSGFVILLTIVGVLFDPMIEGREGVVTMLDAGLVGLGSYTLLNLLEILLSLRLVLPSDSGSQLGSFR